MQCEYCDAVWSSVGLDYPRVDLSGFPFEATCAARVVSLPEYRRLEQQLLAWLPEPRILRPGTGFGPLVGTARGAMEDVVWVHGSSTLLLSRDAFEIVASQTSGVRGERPLLGEGSKQRELVELDLEPCAELHRSAIPFDLAPPCGQCGRWAGRMPEVIVLKSSSIPTNVDAFRGMDLTTAIFASERFADALRSASSDGFELEEIRVEATE